MERDGKEASQARRLAEGSSGGAQRKVVVAPPQVAAAMEGQGGQEGGSKVNAGS